MDAKLDQLLIELEQEGERNDAAQSDKRFKFLNLERPSAELMAWLVEATHRRVVLEIGTSNGYSTIWLAHALRRVHAEDARLTTIERVPEKLAQARRNLERAGLLVSPLVELIVGEATGIVCSLPGPFDCVFFDADRITAPEQLQILLPKLSADVLLMADNALSHPHEVAEYIKMVEQLPGFVVNLVPVGKGLHIAWRRG